MRQNPVYTLGHASSRGKPRSPTPTLDEVEAETSSTCRKIYESAGITAGDLSFENMCDGITQFHQFHIEGLGYRGMGISGGSLETEWSHRLTWPGDRDHNVCEICRILTWDT